MSRTHSVKLFKNGASQAVRLPAELRFEGSQVYASRDERTGDVVLSTRPGAQAWQQFFDLVAGTDAGSDRTFLDDRPMNMQPGERALFDDATA